MAGYVRAAHFQKKRIYKKNQSFRGPKLLFHSQAVDSNQNIAGTKKTSLKKFTC